MILSILALSSSLGQVMGHRGHTAATSSHTNFSSQPASQSATHAPQQNLGTHSQQNNHGGGQATNPHDIVVTYTGTQVGQKMVNGDIVKDSSLPVATVTCGNTTVEIPSDTKTATFKAGSIALLGDTSCGVGSDGKQDYDQVNGVCRNPQPGPGMTCYYGAIGHSGALAPEHLPGTLTEITIGETTKEIRFN